MDKMREALRCWHYEKSEAHDRLDFPKPALNLSSAEGFEAGYTIATAESAQTIAEKDARMAELDARINEVVAFCIQPVSCSDKYAKMALEQVLEHIAKLALPIIPEEK